MVKIEKFIQDITRQAGSLAMEYFGKVGVKYTKKHESDVVTEADLAVNSFLVGEIRKQYPEHGIISEEQGEYQLESEYTWVIDPIDGTLNFATRVPLFCVMVALMKNGEVQYACVNSPAINEFYFAQLGQGAYLNGERVFASKRENLVHSYGCASSSFVGQYGTPLDKIMSRDERSPIFFNSLMCMGVTGSWVAAGKRDWSLSRGGGLWDYAAPVLLMAEAGCRLTTFKGKPWTKEDRELGRLIPYFMKKYLRRSITTPRDLLAEELASQ